jgi:hypothetical protein
LRVPFIIVAKATPAPRFDTDPPEIKRAIKEGACARQGLGPIQIALAALRI